MGTTADKIEYAIDTKNGLKAVLEDNDITAPTAFGDYPTAFDSLIDNCKNLMIYMDTIYINSSTTTAQLNALFKALPLASSYTRTTTTLKCISGCNVRNAAGDSATIIGKVGKTDIVELLGTATANSKTYNKIQRFRSGPNSSNTYNNPLKTYTTTGYVTSSTNNFITNTSGTRPLKKINIAACSDDVQKSCSYSIAEKKGWEIIFSALETSASAAAITQNVTYTFNNCYTDNYSSSSYSNKIGTNTSTVRQGYYSGYYYYKGNFRFSKSRLNEIKSILSNSTVNSMQIYIERANTTHGTSSSATVCLYACDSTGRNADVAVDTSSTLTRGSGKWITLSDTVKNGFISGKYDHFKVYKASTSLSYYIVYNTNAKLRINYTA